MKQYQQEQQQHRAIYINCLKELICPIQQVNVNTSSEKLILLCTCHLILGGYILSQCALHLTS